MVPEHLAEHKRNFSIQVQYVLLEIWQKPVFATAHHDKRLRAISSFKEPDILTVRLSEPLPLFHHHPHPSKTLSLNLGKGHEKVMLSLYILDGGLERFPMEAARSEDRSKGQIELTVREARIRQLEDALRGSATS